MAAKRFFEEFKLGEWVKSHSRRIELCDVRMFASCTSLNHRLFSDDPFCSELEEVQRPLIPSSLLLNVVDGFFAIYVSPEQVPTLHYGYEKIRLIKPVYPGDSVYTVFELLDMSVKNEQFGVLTLNAETYNQHNELVMFHVDKLYVGRMQQA